MQKPNPTIFLATDDMRLQSKAEKLFAKSELSVVIANTSNTLLPRLQKLLRGIAQEERVYVCIDIDAKSFNAYELARTLKEELERGMENEEVNINALFIIGAAFGIEPAVIQKTKLYRIDALLQRFALEKLLRTLAEGLPLSP